MAYNRLDTYPTFSSSWGCPSVINVTNTKLGENVCSPTYQEWSIRRVECWACMLLCWINDCWSCWRVIVLKHWLLGMLLCWRNDYWSCWRVAVLKLKQSDCWSCWRVAVSKHWLSGVLLCRRNGYWSCWIVDVLEVWQPVLLGCWLIHVMMLWMFYTLSTDLCVECQCDKVLEC